MIEAITYIAMALAGIASIVYYVITGQGKKKEDRQNAADNAQTAIDNGDTSAIVNDIDNINRLH